MTDLLNFDDDTDNLFQQAEQQSTPSRDLDDIFGADSDINPSANTLDDILTPSVQDDIFETKTSWSTKKNISTKKLDSLFGADADDEPDLFSSDTRFDQSLKSPNISNPLEDDIFADFLKPSSSSQPNTVTLDNLNLFNEEIKSEKGTNDFDSLFAASQSVPPVVQLHDENVVQSELSMKSHGTSPDQSTDSLDMLLEAQPIGTLPSSDDLLYLVEPYTNTATSSNTHAAQESNTKDSSNKETDPLDDFFWNSEPKQREDLSEEKVEDLKHPEDPEEKPVHIDSEEKPDYSGSKGLPDEFVSEEKPDLFDSKERRVYSDSEEEPVQSNLGTRPLSKLKKSMERSFEDLLNGLSEESEPELDDMIVADIDNTNLESLLRSPDKSPTDLKMESSDFTTPNKSLDDLFGMDFASSTPLDKTSNSLEVKVTASEVKAVTDVDTLVCEAERQGGDNEAGDGNDDVVMRTRKGRKPDSSDEEDFNLEAIEDTNHLDVDVSKHKSALGKQGSMALRRKQSRKSRKSLLSAGEDAIFQDSTDTKPREMRNCSEDAFNDDGFDLSPPAKKPSPAVMLPLPGLAGRPPSQRLSDSTLDDDTMDTKEVKRLSRPPPGAFVLPIPTTRLKPQRNPNAIVEKSSMEQKPAVFQKPALKRVKPQDRSVSPESDQTPVFSRAGLRTTGKSVSPESGQKISDFEETDLTFQKPSLRSTPKPSKEKRSDDKMDTGTDQTFQKPSLRSTPKPSREKLSDEKMDTGIFEKPALRNTPTPRIEPKERQTEEKNIELFETKNLKSAVKRENESVKGSSSDKHVFDKISLRGTGRRLNSEGDSVKDASSSKHDATYFNKPSLRTTNKDLRSDSFGDSSEPSHMFDKPALRSTSRSTSESNKHDTFTHGIFEKPSLKKTTPSPEKELKDFNEPKGTFDRPTLRKTDSIKEVEERGSASDQPDWLQQAASKQSKVLDVLKENQNGHADKEVPSWLDKSPLRKTHALPLQDTSNNQSINDGQSDLSNPEDAGKHSSTPRSSNSSMGMEIEPDRKKTSLSIAPVKETHNNYTPSWMRQRQTRSTSSAATVGLSPAKSLPSLNNCNEVPQWKRELAQRRQTRIENSAEDNIKKDEHADPDWKKGIALRKTRDSAKPSRDVQTVEPEWKKAAEEKRARLRSKSLQYTHFK